MPTLTTRRVQALLVPIDLALPSDSSSLSQPHPSVQLESGTPTVKPGRSFQVDTTATCGVHAVYTRSRPAITDTSNGVLKPTYQTNDIYCGTGAKRGFDYYKLALPACIPLFYADDMTQITCNML